MSRLINADELIKELDRHAFDISLDDLHLLEDVINDMPTVDVNRGQKQFKEILIENYMDKPPYYHIKYTENGEDYIGYSSYDIKIVSGYIREYFMPTVDTERHGHWYIDKQKNIWGDYVNCQVCSVCNKRNIDCEKKSDYCPNCGTKMDEVSE